MSIDLQALITALGWLGSSIEPSPPNFDELSQLSAEKHRFIWKKNTGTQRFDPAKA